MEVANIVARSAEQKRKRQRGEDFQDQLRDSWLQVPNIWRAHLNEASGSRPADDIVLTEPINILFEAKRTEDTAFRLGFLRQNQINGLLDFEKVIDRNYGLVFINFLDHKEGIDETYTFRLIKALKYMLAKESLSIKLEELREGKADSLLLPALPDRLYDVEEVLKCYKQL